MGRKRHRYVGLNTEYYYGYFDDVACSIPTYGELSTGYFTMGAEYMEDVNNTTRRPPSGCHHERAVFYTIPKVVSVWQGNPPYYGKSAYSTPDDILSLVNRDLSPYRTEWQSRCKERVSKMQRVADEFSLLNNAIEAPELPELVEKYLYVGNALTRKRIRNNRVETISDKITNVSSDVNYLDYAFGLEPLIRDIRTLVSNIQNIANRASIKSGIPVDMTDSHTKNIHSVYPGEFGWSRDAVIYGNIKGTVKGTLTPFLPALSEAEFQLRCILDVIGLHLDVLTIYDALPYSWLLDWFLPIGNALKGMTDRRWVKIDLGGVVYVTVRAQGTFQVMARPHENRSGWGDVVGEKGYGDWKYYDRLALNFGRPVRKNVSLSPVVPNFDANKIAILAELARARVQKSKGSKL